MGEPYSAESPWRRSRTAVTVTPPAAGADWSLPVPAGHLYVLRSAFGILTTSAAVANRTARLILGDGTATFLEVPPFAVQAASIVGRYSWLGADVAYALAPAQGLPLPPITLQAGWTVGTSTGLIDVGDQWSGIRLNLIDVTVRGGDNDLNAYPDIVVEVVGPGAG